ncbi:MFS general substrate transporter [Martensiomyces pterosporus]|nr:MFS general substrate transporter [Martensiomyces pterosporus]
MPSSAADREFAVDDINKPLTFSEKDKAHLKSYLWKCDCRLLFYICVGYAADSLNKMALSNAKVAGLTKDLDLHGYDINVALGVYYLGSFIFQLPSNLVLKKVRPTYWLSASMFVWSVVTMSTAFVKNAHQLAFCRFLFGAVQSGYLTGSLYYISYWYPRDEVRKRMGFFFSSAGIGGIIVGPLCSGLSGIKSPHLTAWQCIFVFIGMISGIWSLLGPFVLQDYPDTATFITEDERELITRIMVHQNTVVSNKKISVKQIKMTVSDYKIWLWTLIDFCANGATQVNGMFGPTIIASQGYSPRVAQALSALTNFMAFSGMASIAYVARFARGSSHAIMISNAITMTGFFLALFSPNNTGRMVALFMFSFASPQPAAHSPAWELANQQGNTKPAMAAAFTSAFGGLGPLATAFVYRDKDKPKFVLGHTVCLSMTVLCLAATVLLRHVLNRENRRRDQSPRDISGLTPEEIQDLADNHPDFRYKI